MEQDLVLYGDGALLPGPAPASPREHPSPESGARSRPSTVPKPFLVASKRPEKDTWYDSMAVEKGGFAVPRRDRRHLTDIHNAAVVWAVETHHVNHPAKETLAARLREVPPTFLAPAEAPSPAASDPPGGPPPRPRAPRVQEVRVAPLPSLRAPAPR